ncbi:AzlC family ABC transporter permease [Devosia sp.]|uniref:AzlC family ABC transporter permease n=1 Tax=Devosia sp. TaxID=1871048 RepID=UPI003A93E5D8
MISPARTTTVPFWLGMRLFVPIAISVAAYGVVWGVLAGQAGMTALEVLLMSALVFAGASQFVVLDMWTPGSLPIASIIIATAIVNLRVLLMTASLKPLAAHLPLPRALAAMFLVSDENWALTMTEVRNGRGSIAFLLGAGTLCWAAWLLSTMAGRLLGAFIDDPRTYGLDFAFTATFIALLLGMWKGRGDLVPWLVGGLVAMAVSQWIEGNWYIIAGGLAGSFAGAVVEMRRAPRDAL